MFVLKPKLVKKQLFYVSAQTCLKKIESLNCFKKGKKIADEEGFPECTSKHMKEKTAVGVKQDLF